MVGSRFALDRIHKSLRALLGAGCCKRKLRLVGFGPKHARLIVVEDDLELLILAQGSQALFQLPLRRSKRPTAEVFHAGGAIEHVDEHGARPLDAENLRRHLSSQRPIGSLARQ